MFKKYLLLLIIFISYFFAEAQNGEKVELVQAGSLEGIVLKGEELRKLIGNVVFRHEGSMLYCDSAYQYEKKNEIECFGNVRMVQGDTVTLTGKHLRYNGNTKKAIVTNEVILKDRKMTLYTDYLEYNTRTKLATYLSGGKIIDEENVLTSERGYYSTSSKIFWFKKDVTLVNEKQKYTLDSDTLQYNTNTRIATFRGPSKVTKEKDILYADEGEYETDKAHYKARGRAKIESDTYILEGDRLFYDEVGKHGTAQGNVKMTATENDIIVYGDLAYYWGNDGIVKVMGKPLVKNKMENDTLYLTADTLISVDRKNPKDTTIKEKYLRAFHHVKIFKNDLQGIADSLVYNMVDSTIYFYTDPVLWSMGNQILADSINILLKNKKIHRMNTNVNSFIISQDTAKNFNQVKGKRMTAYFANDKINNVLVSGNGQSIYYAIEEGKTKLIGLNKADCSNISIRFVNGELKNITYINKPDAKFIPPKLIAGEEVKLKGFAWRPDERPQKEQLLGVRFPATEDDFVQIPYRRGYRPPKR